jgi:hypothetical protein
MPTAVLAVAVTARFPLGSVKVLEYERGPLVGFIKSQVVWQFTTRLRIPGDGSVLAWVATEHNNSKGKITHFRLWRIDNSSDQYLVMTECSFGVSLCQCKVKKITN